MHFRHVCQSLRGFYGKEGRGDRKMVTRESGRKPEKSGEMETKGMENFNPKEYFRRRQQLFKFQNRTKDSVLFLLESTE